MQNLPVEIIGLIASDLFWFNDRAAFQSTCSRVDRAMRMYPVKRDIKMKFSDGVLDWKGMITYGHVYVNTLSKDFWNSGYRFRVFSRQISDEPFLEPQWEYNFTCSNVFYRSGVWVAHIEHYPDVAKELFEVSYQVRKLENA